MREGKFPTKCFVLCAERFVTFHDRCKSTIDRMLDNSDHDSHIVATLLPVFVHACCTN